MDRLKCGGRLNRTAVFHGGTTAKGVQEEQVENVQVEGQTKAKV